MDEGGRGRKLKRHVEGTGEEQTGEVKGFMCKQLRAIFSLQMDLKRLGARLNLTIDLCLTRNNDNNNDDTNGRKRIKEY